MPQFLLRVEGVNLANVIDDTDNISTRRGGGLMVLNAAGQLLETLDLQYRKRLHAVATGASIGLYTFEAVDDADAENVRAVVSNHYRDETLEYTIKSDKNKIESDKTEHLPLRWGTFVVDVVPVGGSAKHAEQMAVTRNRWRQMCEPSLSLSGVWEKADQACELDFVRPAVEVVPMAENTKRPASASVHDRHAYGRHARQKFYRDEIGEEPPLDFVNDLVTLATWTGPEGDRKKTAAPLSSRDKIAVFYVDGNQFGSIGRSMWDKEEPLKAFHDWSEAVRGHHQELLRQLLKRASQDRSWQTNHGAIRLETLLWGGDEIIWVVPAWKGWELVEWFFGQDHRVTVNNETRTLTYGAGLVFCHSNAPIKNIIDLAHYGLGEKAKEAGKSSHRVAYEVLESFDDVTVDLDDHRRQWLPQGYPLEKLVLDPVQLRQSWEPLRQIAGSSDFPMRQLYMLVRAWRKREDFQPYRSRLNDCSARDALDAFRESIGDDVAWLHLLQMLPYIPTIQGGQPAEG